MRHQKDLEQLPMADMYFREDGFELYDQIRDKTYYLTLLQHIFIYG